MNKRIVYRIEHKESKLGPYKHNNISYCHALNMAFIVGTKTNTDSKLTYYRKINSHLVKRRDLVFGIWRPSVLPKFIIDPEYLSKKGFEIVIYLTPIISKFGSECIFDKTQSLKLDRFEIINFLDRKIFYVQKYINHYRNSYILPFSSKCDV